MMPRELLDALLVEEHFGADDLDTFIDEREIEGQHHDFKDGAFLEKAKRNQEFRRDVTAFANANGGLLIIGVNEAHKNDDGKRHVTGARAPGGGPLDHWATRTLSSVVGYFSPPPRLLVVDHPSGTVLVVAIPRAPRLIPAGDSSGLIYAMRLGDSTIDVPSFLISDLLLGRRQGPLLELGLTNAVRTQSHSQHSSVTLYFEIDNLAMSAARNLRLGLVYWTADGGRSNVGPQLRAHLSVEPPPEPIDAEVHLQHRALGAMTKELHFDTTVPGLERVARRLVLSNLPAPSAQGAVISQVAVYVMADDVLPRWYQLELNVSADVAVPAKSTFASNARPTVAIDWT